MKRRILRVGLVVLLALGAGHLVQNMQKNQPGRDHVSGALLGGIEQVVAETDVEIRSQDADKLAPAAAPVDPAESAVKPDSGDDQSALTPDAAKPHLAAQADCQPQMTLSALEGAMLSVAITAPCSAGAGVALSHCGLTFAVALDADGRLALEIPAFNRAGQVHALTTDGFFASAATTIPDLAALRRIAVQWVEHDEFQLHALENAANYGDPGDVNAGNPVSPAGGVLIRLGDPGLALPMMAEVYTWPRDSSIITEPVVEAAVTATTCGRRIGGELLRLSDERVTLESLSFDMPDCGAIGDIMVLNNLVPEKTLASVN